MGDSLPSSTLMKILDKSTDANVHSELPILPSNITEPTVTQVWGSFYVQHAPFRGKISPVYALGISIIIKDRVFALDTHRSLPFACVDIWQASPEGQYDYHETDPNVRLEYKEELNTHGRSSHFDYRARLITNEQGQYEFEIVKPVPYSDPNDLTWRDPHIHYYVQATGYKPLVTQLYFKGEEKNDIDRHIQESTTIDLQSMECQRTDGPNYLTGQFDIIMALFSSEKNE